MHQFAQSFLRSAEIIPMILFLTCCSNTEYATPQPEEKITHLEAREAREKALKGDLEALQTMVNWTFELPLDEMLENETMNYWKNRLRTEAKKQNRTTPYGLDHELYKGKIPREAIKP